MDLLQDWWVGWSIDWPFISYTGKANDFYTDYRGTIPAFFADLEATDPEIRKQYYDQQIYDLLLVMVCHKDLASIRRLFDLCPDWSGQGYIEGLTPLGQALDNRDIPCMRLLLERGADPENYDQTTTVLKPRFMMAWTLRSVRCSLTMVQSLPPTPWHGWPRAAIGR